MEQKKDILQQEPVEEPVELNDLKDVGGYVAFLNLDYLDMVFADSGWQGDPDRQQAFIEETQQRLADVILKREGKPRMMMTYSFYDKDGNLRRAIEVMPVATAAKGLKIVTPDVTGYQELRDKLTKVEAENYRLRTQIRNIGETLKANNLISERAFRAHFDREPGGMVEQYEKEHKDCV